MADSISRAVARALRTKRADSPPRTPYLPMPEAENIIPDPVQTGDFGVAETVEERVAFSRLYREAITWKTTLSLRYCRARCPVMPAHAGWGGHWWYDNLPGEDELQSCNRIIQLGERQDAIEASARAQVRRDLARYVPEAVEPPPWMQRGE